MPECISHLEIGTPSESDWFRKEDDVRWQSRGARQIAIGNSPGEPEAERKLKGDPEQ